jgi:hypothetical protein
LKFDIRILKTLKVGVLNAGSNLRKSFVPFLKNYSATTYLRLYIFSELSVSGMHHSLAKQNAFIANVNLEILPVNLALVPWGLCDPSPL